MYIIGIILAIVMTLSKVIDTLINKKIVDRNDPIMHSMNRIIIVSPLLFFAALSDWYISSDAYLLLFLFALFECFNIVFHQSSLKYLRPYTADVISKSKVITVLIIAIALGITTPNIYTIGGSIVFFVGLILLIDRKNNSEGKEVKSEKLGIMLQTFSVLCRSAKPFILKYILLNELASNETIVFLSMPISLIILLVMFRRKPSINRENIKIYSIQSLFVAVSMILVGYAVLNSSEIAVSIIESFSVSILFITSWIIEKERQPLIKIAGVAISLIGMIILVVM